MVTHHDPGKRITKRHMLIPKMGDQREAIAEAAER